MRKTINVVWIKRDIRSRDHAPLARAEQYNEPYILLFLFEPSITNRPDVSVRHLQFQYLSLLKLCSKLEVFGKKLYMCMGEAIEEDFYPPRIRDHFDVAWECATTKEDPDGDMVLTPSAKASSGRPVRLK